jgi:hypothetical protein
VLGYADDFIAVLLTLRSVVRIVGEEPLRNHWPSNPAGLDLIAKLSHAGPAGTVSGPGQGQLAWLSRPASTVRSSCISARFHWPTSRRPLTTADRAFGAIAQLGSLRLTQAERLGTVSRSRRVRMACTTRQPGVWRHADRADDGRRERADQQRSVLKST